MKILSNEMALDQLETKQRSYFRWEGTGGGCTGALGHSCYQGQPSSPRPCWPITPLAFGAFRPSLSLSCVFFHLKSLGMILEALGLSLAPAQVWTGAQQISLPLSIATPYRTPTQENGSGSATNQQWPSRPAMAWPPLPG